MIVFFSLTILCLDSKVLLNKSQLINLIYDEIDVYKNIKSQFEMILSLKNVTNDISSNNYLESILSCENFIEIFYNSFNTHHYVNQFLLLLRLYCYNPNVVNNIRFNNFYHEDVFNQIVNSKEWNYNIDYDICHYYYTLLFPIVKYLPIEIFSVKNSLIEVKELKMEENSEKNKFKSFLPVKKFRFSQRAMLYIVSNLSCIKELNVDSIYNNIIYCNL